MTELLLKLLNVPVDDGVRIAGASLAFRSALGAGWFVFFVIATVALIYWLYRSSPVTVAPWRRHALTALRVLFVGMMLALLLRPVLAFTVEGSIRRVLVMLIDGSSSMQIKDPRLTPNDQRRAAIARDIIDPAKGLSQAPDRSRAKDYEQVARLDLTKGVLQNERLNLLPRLDKEFDLTAFSFGDRKSVV